VRSSHIPNPAGREEIPWDFEGARRHHIRLGLQMTPAERLRWLEDTVAEMRQLQGLARKSQKIQDVCRETDLLLAEPGRETERKAESS
jgi:hypothetical protein